MQTTQAAVSSRQLFAIVFILQNGYQWFRKPWANGIENLIITFIGALLAQLFLYILWLLLVKNTRITSFYGWISANCGNIFSKMIFIAIALFAAYPVCIDTNYMLDLINIWVLTSTPTSALALCALSIFWYAAASKLQDILNVLMMCLIPAFISFGFFLYFICMDWDINALLPIWDRFNEQRSFLEGVFRSFAAFSAYLFLFYVLPLVDKSQTKQSLIMVSAANWTSFLFYCSVSILTSLQYTANQMEIVPNPILFALKQLETGAFQSIDLLFGVMWIFVGSIRIILFWYMASKALDEMTGKPKNKQAWWAGLLAVLCFCVVIFVKDHFVIVALLDASIYLTVFGLLTVAVFIWLMESRKRLANRRRVT
ncbi:GerAB/ArcD/ProY family transporter [Paenibacillus sp. strain BS8-2]